MSGLDVADIDIKTFMDGPAELILEARQRDLVDGFKVRRVLPSAKRRMVGPFIFFDEMGPEILAPGSGLDVAPHPHIGLATVTYLFTGKLVHRDSVGSVQSIEPGDVNLMTAGSGIAHSERTPDDLRASGSDLFGIQSWIALPVRDEETAPSFSHHAKSELPVIEDKGKTVRLIAGSLYGERSPVRTFSGTFYADVLLNSGTKLQVTAEYPERAIFIVNGKLRLLPDHGTFSASQLVVLRPGEEVIFAAEDEPAHFMLLGGDPLDGKRFIWWNFVSSSAERIELAKADWKNGRFSLIPGETEFIPLPAESRPAIPRYP